MAHAAADDDRRSTDSACKVVETHISRLFFTPDRVYKLLKPIKTGFLDHTDSASRVTAATAELTLNRRLARDVYVGLADVREGDEITDRMIVMRRLPDDRRLATLVESPDLFDYLRSVAKAIATFHAGLAPIIRAVPLGTADGLARFWKSSIDDMAPFVGELFEPDEFDAVHRMVFAFLDHHGRLFDARRAAGFVRDGHGDLIAHDIFMLDDGPRILDCLAFDDAYRICDVLADIAFLVMDIERLAGRDAARHLLRCYCEFSNEHHPSSLAHHYVAYRAHVRAKVASLRWSQGDAGAAAEARSHHAQAYDHLSRARPTMLLLGGGPGTGKSTLADAIGGALGWPTVDADTLRKDLRGVDHDDHRVELHPDLYSPATTDETYRRLIERAAAVLASGESVIVDATWARAAHRSQARRAAIESGARLVEIDCQLDHGTTVARLAARQLHGLDVSDATASLATAPRDHWPTALRIDTSGPVDDVCERAVSLITAPY
jgi:aminoglycoside phosphotransferase family enzyme/predicted kinase